MTSISLDFLKEHPIAHRGYFDNSGASPENSLAAILSAVHGGFASELDVMLSRDGEVMVFHDDTLDRMCSLSREFSAMNSLELQNIRLGVSSERIPTLAQVLSCVQGRRPIIIELKSFSRRGIDTNGLLERKVAELLATYKGPVALKSFNAFSVKELLRIRTRADHWPVGFISCNYRKDPDFAFLTKEESEGYTNLRAGIAPPCEFVSYNINDLSPGLSQEIRTRCPLIVWTVKTEEQYLKAMKLADNVVFEWHGVQPRAVVEDIQK